MTSERETKRIALLDAAMAVFIRKGFARTRVADIAEEADVGKGTVYEYFSSKEALFFAVFERIHESISNRLKADVAKPGTARERLQRIFAGASKVLRSQVENQAVVLDFWAASRGKLLEEQFRDFCVASYDFYREMFAQILRDGQKAGELKSSHDPNDLAIIVVAAFDGLGAQLFFDRSVDVERAVTAFCNTLCDALCLED